MTEMPQFYEVGFNAYLEGASMVDLKHHSRPDWTQEQRAEMFRGWREARELDAKTGPHS